MKYKYINFQKDSDGAIECRTNRGNDLLGEISWESRWKCHEFIPEFGTGFSWDCCRDISSYLKTLDDNRKS